MKILVINPGSTSTKIAVYENETPLLVSNIKHTVEELSVYPQVILWCRNPKQGCRNAGRVLAGEEHHRYAAQSTCHWKLINDQSEARQPIEAAGGVSETDNARRRRFRFRQHSRSKT